MDGAGVLAVAREVQIPLLAVLLIGGCAAKARRALGARSIEAGIGPTGMFPFSLQRPAAIVIFVSELALGVGLLVTAGRIGVGLPAVAVRAATFVLFCTAVAALAELRSRRPDVGCGCFGDVSSTPVGWRTITRAALLGAAFLVEAHRLHWQARKGVTGVALKPMRMFHFSNSYLALLFVLLAVDPLLRHI